MIRRNQPGRHGLPESTKFERGNVRLYGRSERVLSPAQRGEATESGPIPPEIDWSELKAYVCNACKDHCINWIEADCTEANECRSCYRVTELLSSSSTIASEGEAARLGASPASDEIAPSGRSGATASTDRKRTPSHGGPTRKPERTPRPRREERENQRATGP